MSIRNLQWSKMASGTCNGKKGPLTIFTVAFSATRGWFVSSKVPPQKTFPVDNPEEGKDMAERLFRDFRTIINSR